MLNALFGPKTYLEPEVEDWHLETWALLIRELGHPKGADLVTPTRDFFPPTEATGHERAEHVFAAVKAAMGMSQWPCRLEPQDDRPSSQQVSQFVVVQTEGAANGTFRVEDGEVVITYAPELLGRPWDLVATLAHELSHYLLAPHHGELGEDLHELATDLAVAYAGLGVFGANTAFSFDQHGDAFSQGWGWRRNGYLSPRSWAFALAVFMRLSGSDAEIERWLKPEVADLYRKAVKYLDRKPELLSELAA